MNGIIEGQSRQYFIAVIFHAASVGIKSGEYRIIPLHEIIKGRRLLNPYFAQLIEQKYAWLTTVIICLCL
jgi:hypothetical protein